MHPRTRHTGFGLKKLAWLLRKPRRVSKLQPLRFTGFNDSWVGREKILFPPFFLSVFVQPRACYALAAHKPMGCDVGWGDPSRRMCVSIHHTAVQGTGRKHCCRVIASRARVTRVLTTDYICSMYSACPHSRLCWGLSEQFACRLVSSKHQASMENKLPNATSYLRSEPVLSPSFPQLLLNLLHFPVNNIDTMTGHWWTQAPNVKLYAPSQVIPIKHGSSA